MQKHYSNKLGTKHPRVEGIQVCSNERACPFQGRNGQQTINQPACTGMIILALDTISFILHSSFEISKNDKKINIM